MKQIRFDNNKTSSGRNSRILATQQMLHRIVAILVLAFVCSGAWAVDYVFISNGNFMAVENGALIATTTFNPQTCIWNASNTLGNSSRTISITIDGTTYSLRGTTTDGGALTLGTATNFRSDGNLGYYSLRYYYVYYNNGWKCSRYNTSYGSNRTVPYAVTANDASDFTFNISSPTAGAHIGQVNGTMPISAQASGNFSPECYYFNDKYYYSTNGGETYTSNGKKPQVSTYNYSYEIISGGENASINGNIVTYTKDAGHDVEVVVRVTANPQDYDDVKKTAECSFTLYSATVTTPVITPGPGQNQYTITGPVNSTIKYTINGQDIDASGSNGTTYNGPVTVTTPNTTIKAKAVRDGHVSAQTEYTITTVTLEAPTITISDAGSVTITNPNGSVGTIHYTIDGSEPTASSDTYSASFTVNNMATVKAIVTGGAGYTASAVASKQYKIESGIDTDGGIVTLNDYEDHTWTYYTGVSSDVDGGNYNTNYAGILYSPDPRNVKITYKGGSVSGASAVAVSATESANQFVYYKTIEKVNNAYTYQVISNPFSKRPRTNNSTGTNGYWGFAGWKIINGGKYIVGHDNNDVLVLDETITLTNFDDGYTPNCTSAVIELEATWTAATVRTSAPGTSDFTSGTYETNFWVLTANVGATTFNKNMTVSARYPDGTSSGDFGFNDALTVSDTFTGTVKLEYLNLTGGNNINAGGRNLYIGRGISGTSTRTIYGTYTSGSGMNQVLKVESGTYSRYNGYGVNPGGHTKQIIVFGNDYDRANNDNSKLNITGKIMGVNDQTAIGQTSITHELMHFIVKSGKLISSHPSPTVANYDNSIYMLDYGHNNNGIRILEMEGGEVFNIIGGANACGDGKTDINIKIRIKGGTIPGCVYGGGARYDSNGSKQFVFTGGTINGWIAGGCNGFEAAESGSGTSSQYGSIDGQSYIYVGGNTVVGGNESSIDKSIGGYVFGAGAGKSTTSQVGRAKSGTNVVLADNASVKHGIYGGGAYGYCDEGKKATIYITGGTVEAEYDDVYDVPGGVYGGARQNKGGYANIYMTGGLVKGGIYGGSNASGTMANDVMIQINGGQVGTSAKTANIHGGGYGQPTVISGNVDITLGATGADRDADGVVVYGDVYGGSALGRVNGTAATTTYHTNVTMNAGYIHGSLYGGALGAEGTAANVYGPVQVKVYGGSVMKTDENGSGAVYGANNINGAPQRSVTVDIYGTNSAPEEGEYALYSVYGGGNAADYSHDYAKNNGYPKVTVHNCDNSIEYVYGGGNAAAVAATDVTVYGGDVIGNVFGGGNGQVTAANVTGNTSVWIYGGTIGDVYGGSNTNGTIGGTISVNVNAQAESGHDACEIDITNVYGGGNKAASNAGSVTIGCAEHIGAVYGGANQANITGDINLKIESGHIDNVFGGNNNSGAINGKIAVTIEDKENTCGMEVGNVYAGGNKAFYSIYGYDTDGNAKTSGSNPYSDPVVNIKKGTVTGDVFGGGLGSTAVITGNPTVNISGGTLSSNVFGGGQEANVTGSTTVNVSGGTIAGDVYGGGALANISGNTTVSLTGGTVGNVYGGGLGRNTSGTEGSSDYLPAVAALVGGNTNVTLGGTVGGNLVGSVVTGSIFGCNNINGTPQGHAKVLINKTTAQSGAATDAYHVAAVYGGGNQAAYIPTSSTDFAEVEVVGCNNSIQYVYGGGNAASTPATKVTIEGGRLYYVFGGGNGKTEDGATIQNPGADVGYKNWTYDDTNAYGAGTTNVNIYGGTIISVFGGSNTKGNIRVASNVTLDDSGECDFEIGDVYGAGNEAEMYGNGNLTIGCIPGLDEIYGGAKNANINGDVSITITNGTFGKVFGGNNLGGDIKGSITVNIEETGCRPIIIGELYGGGNLAAYTAPTATTYGDNAGKYPMVNVKSFTSIGTVFGAGLGMTDAKIDALPADDLKEAAKALGKTDDEIEDLSDDALKALTKPYFKAKGVVHGSPQVNIGLIEGKFANGGSHGSETFPAISNKWNNKLGTIGTVYGGGNAANVEGDTYVNIGTVSTINLVSGTDHSDKSVEGVNISGNVYGGGNAADVTGKTNVQIGQAGTTSSGE